MEDDFITSILRIHESMSMVVTFASSISLVITLVSSTSIDLALLSSGSAGIVIPPVSMLSSSSLGIFKKQCIVSSSSCSIVELLLLRLSFVGRETSRCFDGICIVIVCDVPSADVEEDIKFASSASPSFEKAPRQL